jgi:hypothetical protein
LRKKPVSVPAVRRGTPVKQGQDKAWETLAASDPSDVCERSGAEYSAADRTYTVAVLGQAIVVDVDARTLEGSSPESEFILTKTAYFSRLSILHYLLGAKKIAPTGQLIKPTELKSGQIYVKGSHLLPMDGIANRFSGDPEGFLRQGARYGGEPRPYGDAAVELRPFSRVPVTIIFWLEDEEFPGRSYLLFDETCEEHLPPDIVWSVAMMCALAMLKG